MSCRDVDADRMWQTATFDDTDLRSGAALYELGQREVEAAARSRQWCAVLLR